MSIPYLKGRDYSSLAQALGMGIGNYAGSKLTERAINKAKSSPEYAEGDLATKGSLLRKATSLYGNRGAEAAEQELKLEEKRGNKSVEQEYQRVSSIIADPNVEPSQKLAAINGSKLPLNDKKALATSYNAFRRNEIADKKAGVTNSKFAPTPPDIVEKIEKFTEKPGYEKMSDEQVRIGMEKAGIPRGEVDAFLKDRQNARDNAIKGEEFKYKLHKDSEEFRKTLSEDVKKGQQLRNIGKGIRSAMKQSKTGAITPANIAKSIFKGTFLENVATDSPTAFIEAAQPLYFGAFKDTFGGVLTDAKLELLAKKAVDIGKSPEANEAIIEMQDLAADAADAKQEIADAILKENGGFAPLDFESKVNQEFNRVYKDEIEKAYEEFFDSTGYIKKVPLGTKISEEIAQKYYDLAQGDKQEARRMAKEDGYEF